MKMINYNVIKSVMTADSDNITQCKREKNTSIIK